jgi:hypothetical protein
MPLAEGPWSVANSPGLTGGRAVDQEGDVALLEAARHWAGFTWVWVKPISSSLATMAAGSGPVNSTNSKPSTPSGFSWSSRLSASLCGASCMGASPERGADSGAGPRSAATRRQHLGVALGASGSAPIPDRPAGPRSASPRRRGATGGAPGQEALALLRRPARPRDRRGRAAPVRRRRAPPRPPATKALDTGGCQLDGMPGLMDPRVHHQPVSPAPCVAADQVRPDVLLEQFGGHRAEGVALEIALQPGVEPLAPDEPLDGAQEGGALLIGDVGQALVRIPAGRGRAAAGCRRPAGPPACVCRSPQPSDCSISARSGPYSASMIRFSK